jgi:hypothetical protein
VKNLFISGSQALRDRNLYDSNIRKYIHPGDKKLALITNEISQKKGIEKVGPLRVIC